MTGDLYSWLKALHIISVIAWMAGMLYLPRLYVYHCAAKPGSELSETFKVMERRLMRAIINPAMTATFVFGLWMAWLGELWTQPWFVCKIVLVLGMSALHGFLSRWRKDFAADANKHSARFYRFMNEVPTLLLIGIVLLVVLKPF
ncbi:MAG TPA: protoporphyrinogen oxidase HemJ [Dongiaceae bacterium]|nr:protoporphyrinogen oxidase HemJ [Dongiaceae bacterium]